MHVYTTHQSTRCSFVVSDVVTVTNIKGHMHMMSVCDTFASIACEVGFQFPHEKKKRFYMCFFNHIELLSSNSWHLCFQTNMKFAPYF